MKINKQDEYLIVVSTIVAILGSKVADFLLPKSAFYKFTNSSFDPFLGLLVNIVIIIAIILTILRVVKPVVKRIMSEE